MIHISNIDKKSINARALLRHEPKWMREQRFQAWERFEESMEPKWEKEKMPYIDLEESLSIRPISNIVQPLYIYKTPPESKAGTIILEDGKVTELTLQSELSYEGVILCDMQTALLERADLLECYFKGYSCDTQDLFTEAHKALWENGYFLFIPKGLRVEEPFEVRTIQGTDDYSTIHHNLVVLEDMASAKLDTKSISKEGKKNLIISSRSTQIYVHKGAQLRHISTQDFNNHVYDLSYHHLISEKDSSIQSSFVLLGARAGRTVICADAKEEGASIEQDGLIIFCDQQRFKIISKMKHSCENTQGVMKYHGVLQDESYTFIDGVILVEEKAKKTRSHLEENILLLGEKTSCDTLPALDIMTGDIQVSHSAAVSSTDIEKIFYLMSRGLSQEEAKQIIIQGFFETLLKNIQDPQWRGRTRSLIEDKLSIDYTR